MFSTIPMDPHLPDYDPAQIADLFGVTPSEIVAHEPVVESFARPRSMRLRAILERDLANDFPDANVTSVNCRTSSCSIEIKCPPSQGDAIFEYVQHPTLGDEVQPNIERGDEQSTIHVYILYRKEHRAADGFDAFYRQERELLPEMRQAGMLVPGLD